MGHEGIKIKNPLALKMASEVVALGLSRSLAEALSDHAIISLRETLRNERAPRRSKALATTHAGHAGE